MLSVASICLTIKDLRQFSRSTELVILVSSSNDNSINGETVLGIAF